jgi:hypothetical protein
VFAIKRAGDEGGGYEITPLLREKTLRFECWGYWSVETANAFARDAVTACQNMTLFSFVVLDARQMKPQGKHGQASLESLMNCLASAPPVRATMLAANILTRMQLTRIAQAAGVGSLMRFSDRPTSGPPGVSSKG